MGMDKAFLYYHAKNQAEHLGEILLDLRLPFVVSCRPDQVDLLPKEFDTILDLEIAQGPISGIRSVMISNPSKSCLFLPCDLPFLEATAIESLIQTRDMANDITCFKNEGDIAPLPSIWEPWVLTDLDSYYNQGKRGLMEFMHTKRLKLIPAAMESMFRNANTPQEYQAIKDTINKGAR